MQKESSTTKGSIEQIKAKHEARLLSVEGVEGVGIGEDNGKPVIKVYVTKKTKAVHENIPERLDGYPVVMEVTGEFHAL